MSMFAVLENLDVVKILSYGVVGLGLLLALLAFWLLRKEQSKAKPDEKILHSVQRFMVFSVVLCLIGVGSQLLDRLSTGSSHEKATRDMQSDIDKWKDESKAKDDKITKLEAAAVQHENQRTLVISKLNEIDVAILEKEFAELQSMLADTDPARRERLKKTIDGLRKRVAGAKSIVEEK